MKKEDIVSAWAEIRENNNSIPDDVLDFMKDSAIKIIDIQESEKKMMSNFKSLDNQEPFIQNEWLDKNPSMPVEPSFVFPKNDLSIRIKDIARTKDPKYTIGYSEISGVAAYTLMVEFSYKKDIELIALDSVSLYENKNFKEDVLAMARVLGATFLEEK